VCSSDLARGGARGGAAGELPDRARRRRGLSRAEPRLPARNRDRPDRRRRRGRASGQRPMRLRARGGAGGARLQGGAAAGRCAGDDRRGCRPELQQRPRRRSHALRSSAMKEKPETLWTLVGLGAIAALIVFADQAIYVWMKGLDGPLVRILREITEIGNARWYLFGMPVGF